MFAGQRCLKVGARILFLSFTSAAVFCQPANTTCGWCGSGDVPFEGVSNRAAPIAAIIEMECDAA
jgi:hypothetical protein